MNKIQHRDICLKLESRFDSNSINATVFKFGDGELTCNDDGSWCFKGDADKSALELLEFLSRHSMTQINEMQDQINTLKATLEFARKFVGHGLVDLNEDGNSIVTIKSVIDDVLEGE